MGWQNEHLLFLKYCYTLQSLLRKFDVIFRSGNFWPQIYILKKGARKILHIWQLFLLVASLATTFHFNHSIGGAEGKYCVNDKELRTHLEYRFRFHVSQMKAKQLYKKWAGVRNVNTLKLKIIRKLMTKKLL